MNCRPFYGHFVNVVGFESDSGCNTRPTKWRNVVMLNLTMSQYTVLLQLAFCSSTILGRLELLCKPERQYLLSCKVKAQTHMIQSGTTSAQKNEDVWFVRCDSLGVRQNSLINLRERGMNVFHLLCASTSAHSFCMFKNVGVFPRVNIDIRRTSDQR